MTQLETVIIKYLNGVMDVKAYAERPRRPEASYILVERTGGGTLENQIRQAMVTIQCYAPSLLSAALLCDQMIHAMEDADDLEPISRCELNSSYNYTDSDTKEYRYQAVFDITYYDE